jgi:hypothetical protein
MVLSGLISVKRKLDGPQRTDTGDLKNPIIQKMMKLTSKKCSPVVIVVLTFQKAVNIDVVKFITNKMVFSFTLLDSRGSAG